MNAPTPPFQHRRSSRNEVDNSKGPIGNPETCSRLGFVASACQTAWQTAAQPGATSCGHSRSCPCRVGTEDDPAGRKAAVASGFGRETASLPGQRYLVDGGGANHLAQ